jgi:hypothetical protein
MPSALNFCTGSSHQQMRMARKAIARAASTRDLAMAPDGESLFSARRVLSVIDEFTLGTLSSDSSPGHGTYSEEDFPPRALAQRAFAVAADAVSDPRKRLR